jgi:hypothetical protein
MGKSDINRFFTKMLGAFDSNDAPSNPDFLRPDAPARWIKRWSERRREFYLVDITEEKRCRNVVPNYLRPGLLHESRERALREAEGIQWPRFDAFVVTGISGIAFGSVLAHKLGKDLVIVRKQEMPRPHSANLVEGREGKFLWVFLDDHISSGNTWVRVRDTMEMERKRSHCIGMYLYEDPRSAGARYDGRPVINADPDRA